MAASRPRCGARIALVAAGLDLQILLEKPAHGADGCDPVAPEKGIVDIVGQDEFFDLDLLFPKAAREIDGLVEVYRAIVIAVDEQDGRFPGGDGRDRRRFEGDLQRLLHVRLGQAVADDGTSQLSRIHGVQAIVDAVDIDAGRKNIRIPPKRERRQITPERRAPDADTIRIHIRAALQIASGRQNVSILGSAARPRVIRELERLAVADAQPVIHGEYDEPAVHQILVRAVIVRVFPPIVPAEQHLAGAAAVNVNDGGFARVASRRFEELPVRFDSVVRSKRHRFRSDELRRREIRRQQMGSQWPKVSSREKILPETLHILVGIHRFGHCAHYSCILDLRKSFLMCDFPAFKNHRST